MQKSRMCMRRNCILILLAMDNVDSSMLGIKQCAMPRVDGRVVVDGREIDGKELVRRAMRLLLCGRDILGWAGTDLASCGSCERTLWKLRLAN
jgi:hypothetical protein